MPVLAEYRPTQTPGANAQNFLNGYEQVSSLMERKQRLQMAQEDQAMERAKFEAFKPAIYAKAQADLVSAGAAIANTARMEQLRAQAAASSADYNDRFLNIMSISDDKERSDTLGAFMGEVSWLDNPALPEYQGFAKAVKDERAKAFTMAATNIKLDQHLDELVKTNETRRAIAETQAGQRVTTATIRAASQERIKQIDSDTKLSVEDRKAAKQGIMVADLQERAATAEQDAADAERDGNPKLAQSYRVAAAQFRDAIQHTTTFSGYAPSAPKPKAEDPTPSPKQTTPSPPALTFMGKSLAGSDSAPAQAATYPSEAQPAAPAGRLYVIDAKTRTPAFSPSVKTPQQQITAVQQMLDDKILESPEQARELLLKLGFKPKK